MIYALDASAMLAYLRQEAGEDIVAELLADPNNECFAHAVKLCEVYRGFLASANRTAAEAAIQGLYTDGVLPREDMDQPFWQDIGDMIALARATPGMALGLADAFGLALARRLGCEFVTSDHRDMDPLLPLGLCPVRFIR